MVYILDAYNVIHKIRSLERALEKDLRAAREALIAACGRLAARRGDISQIILVFDGNSKFWDIPHLCPPKIKLVFSETGEDADDRIVTVLEDLPAKAAPCVVSDDNSVRNHARSHKTRVMPAAEFETLLDPDGTQGKKKAPSNTFSLSQKLADEITAAYKKDLGIK